MDIPPFRQIFSPHSLQNTMKRILPGLILALLLLCPSALAETTNETQTIPTTTVTTAAPTTTPEPTAIIQAVTTAMTRAIGGGTGWFDIHTNIDGAAVSFDGDYKGTTAQGILTVAWATTGTPPGTVTATKSGYTTAQTALPSVPAAGHHAAVYLTLNPTTPQTGTMGLTSTPKGANIRINGVFYGTTPHTVTGLAPGEYLVSVDYPGYHTWTADEEIVAGKTTYVDAVLKQVQQYGTLSISSTPGGAYITLDGVYYGQTPAARARSPSPRRPPGRRSTSTTSPTASPR